VSIKPLKLATPHRKACGSLRLKHAHLRGGRYGLRHGASLHGPNWAHGSRMRCRLGPRVEETRRNPGSRMRKSDGRLRQPKPGCAVRLIERRDQTFWTTFETSGRPMPVTCHSECRWFSTSPTAANETAYQECHHPKIVSLASAEPTTEQKFVVG
jgi:hypothetical protein